MENYVWMWSSMMWNRNSDMEYGIWNPGSVSIRRKKIFGMTSEKDGCYDRLGFSSIKFAFCFIKPVWMLLCISLLWTLLR